MTEAIATPPTFEEGAVKQDPESKAVAVRTNYPDPYFDHQWGVMTIDRGGHYSSFDEVESWPDMVPGTTRETEQENEREQE